VALRNAVLAALLDGEASGYDLAKLFDASVANFWMASPQQLYHELERMAAQGLIEAREVLQDRRPNKRVFRLTDRGREELHEFTRAPARPLALRDELLVKVHAVDAGDAEAVGAAVADLLQCARAKLARYDRLRARLLAGRSEQEYLADAERVGPYLTLMRGRAFEQENITWAEQTLAALRERWPRVSQGQPAGPD
jgi:DNA-binding PadR family transcriptional regulator